MTPLAVLALSHFPSDREHARRGAQWLLSQEGRSYSWLTKIFLRLFPDRVVIDLDPDLKGWPWMADTFSWVEPTAYALIALKCLRHELPDDLAAARIGEGERMIFDRMCRGGGWNYGNSRVLDEDLWPYPDTTALALIALQNHPARREVQLGIRALDDMLAVNSSGLALALAILSFRLFGRDVAALQARLEQGLDEILALGETRAIALTVLAMDQASGVPFAIPGHARS